MIVQAAGALRDPAGFFDWLRGEAPRPWAAYCVPLVQALASGVLGLLTVLGSDSPELQELRSLLDPVNLPPSALLVASVVVAPFSALVTWALVWLPVRAGAGPVPRLWEVAAWSQLPALAILVAQGFALQLAGAEPVTSALLSLLGVAWSAAFVHAGVQRLGEGNAVRAALVYGIFWSLPPLFSLLLSQPPGSSGGLMA